MTRHIKLFEELTNPPIFNVKYYWRSTIEKITYFLSKYVEVEIKKEDISDGVMMLTILNGKKSCKLKFDHTNCFLNDEKIVNVHDNLLNKIINCLEIEKIN